MYLGKKKFLTKERGKTASYNHLNENKFFFQKKNNLKAKMYQAYDKWLRTPVVKMPVFVSKIFKFQISTYCVYRVFGQLNLAMVVWF